MNSFLNLTGYLLTGLGLFINAIPSSAPEKVYIYRYPLKQWSCSHQEHIEYHGSCSHQRAIDKRIKPHD